ncbi:glycosyltransferase family 2 protein [Limosilactobacillus fermentum]
MKEQPLVSVIIPVYNVERFLDKCIISVLEQSYSNIEILLVDDGSTDSSGSICRKYSKKYKNVKYLHESNKGLSAARNYGLDVCNGKYVLFVDSDDFIRNNLIENILNIALTEKADIVEFNYLLVGGKDKQWPKVTNAYKVLDHEKALMSCLNYESSVMVWNKLYRKNLFKGIRFPVGKIHEDEAIAPYLTDKANIYVKVDDCYYAYVKRKGSIMNSNFSDNELFIINIFQKRLKYFSQKYGEKYDPIINYHYFLRLKNLVSNMPKYSENRSKLIIAKHELYKRLLNNKLSKKLRIKTVVYNYMPDFIYKRRV